MWKKVGTFLGSGGTVVNRVYFYARWVLSWKRVGLMLLGPIFADLLNWTALLFSGAVNFILPLCLYLIAKKV